MFALFTCHSRAVPVPAKAWGGNPLWLGRWIPAIVYPRAVPVPAKAWGGGRACPHEGGGMITSLVAGFLQT